MIPFLISLLNVDEKYLLKVKVFPGNQTPYFIKKKGVDQGTYIRVGSTNRLADRDVIKSLERRSQNISFDSLPCHDDEFTPDSLRDFVQTYSQETSRTLDQEGFQKLGLILKYGDKTLPTNAAILLSTSEIRKKIFPYVKIECARFKGENLGEIIDSLSVNQPLHKQADDVFAFIKRNIRKESSIVGLKRIERYEYPISAIREILFNAIVHRDYSMLGRDVKVAIYDDMIEITSPGGLLPGIDLGLIGTGQSEIRNRVLAPIFKDLGLIEQWGTGFRKIKKEVESYPDLSLQFNDTGVSFQVQLIKKEYLEVARASTAQAPRKHCASRKVRYADARSEDQNNT